MATPTPPPTPPDPPTAHPPVPAPAEARPAGDTPPTAAPAGASPAPAGQTPEGPLAQLLTPVSPARPTAPLGSTATLGQGTAGTPDAAKTADGKGPDPGSEGPLSALVRALASRWGRTGTTTAIKRNHAVTETRVSGNSTTTSNNNKSDRVAKNERSAQHRSNQDAKSSRDAKVADLNNKTSAQHGKSTSESKRAANSDAKRADNRDTKRSDAKDAKSSDSRAAKDDTATRASTDSRSSKGSDAKTSKSSDVKSAKADRESKPGGRSGSGADRAGDKSGTGPKPDSQGTPDRPASKPDDPGQAGAKAGKDTKPAEAKVDLAKKEKNPESGTNVAGGGPADGGSTPPRTRPAREAGYRDGKRAAGAVGHAQAYRDGVKDGWSDRQAADKAERKKMDALKLANALRPRPPLAPTMGRAGGSTADLARKEQQKPKAAPVPPKPATAPTVPVQAGGPDRRKSGVDLAKKPVVPPKPTMAPTVPAQTGGPGRPMNGVDMVKEPAERRPEPAAEKVQLGPVARSGPVATAATAVTSGGPDVVAVTAAAAVEDAVRPRPAAPAPGAPTTIAGRSAHPMSRDDAEPAEVRHVGAEVVAFTVDNGHHVLSRGEVRSLKAFERRMAEKEKQLARIAEGSKQTAAIAAGHARSAQVLLESAKKEGVGNGLVGVITRLAEQVALLRAKAEAVERDAHRGAEAVSVLVANAEMRHGGIYQAVVDSPLTTPAERTFYQDKQGG
ncbi:hypothetical protein [Kitasatospora sp. NPDC094015]|uniref:hypothetical protein n=1 Tax=Kitasatospora sp. NPDC094015 TaxID=3155205 RepID=UPI0033185396